MKKILSRIMAVMLIATVILSGTCINSKAASYPTVFFFSDEEFNNLIDSDTATVGDVVYIRMQWFAAFNNEGYDIAIYNSDNQVVSTLSSTWTNTKYIKNITVRWDTKGLKSDIYTVEVTKKFYSYYRWNEAPTKAELLITLNANESAESSTVTASKKPSKVTGFTAKNSAKKAIVINFKKSKNARKYKIQYSSDKRFKKKVKTKTITKTSYTIKNLKKKSTYYVRVCAVNGNKTSAWTTAKKVKIIK